MAPGRRLRTRLAGAFLFLPLLARLRFDQLVERAGYPGSAMIPAPAALLSLLALKLLDKERRSHVNDFNFDEALGLFAGLTRAEQAGEVLRFVDFWQELTGADPAWLYFDSKVTTYPELCRLNQRGIGFVTIRRRGTAVVRRLRQLPASAWQKAVIDTPKRFHQHVRYVDESVRLPGYQGAVRQLAVDGLGKEQPALLLSNNSAETARSLLIRYAGRKRVEDGRGQCVNFFHLNCLASEVRLNVALDAALTVLAQGCYRWLGKQLRGFEKAAPKQLYRRFVETAGLVEVEADRVVVRFDRRSHNPILREAALDRDALTIPWLQGRKINFLYT